MKMKLNKFLLTAIVFCIISIQNVCAVSNIILFGFPGSGKGTLSQKLIEKNDYTHICPGNILRAEVRKQSDFGKRIEPILQQGYYAPDQEVFAFLKDKIVEDHNKNLPIIFDGYPRSKEALHLLDALLKDLGIKEDTLVLSLNIEKEKLMDRVLNRAVCNHCDKVYTTKQTHCQACHKKLEKRPQDTAEILERRINGYMEIAQPLIHSFTNYGYKVIGIDADRDPDEIFNYVCHIINQSGIEMP